jgi:histidyl-tRNA synthetase
MATPLWQGYQWACRLRDAGRRVDVILDVKKMKWAFKHAERVSAERLIIVGQREWDQGCVRVKRLQERKEEDVSIDRLA